MRITKEKVFFEHMRVTGFVLIKNEVTDETKKTHTKYKVKWYSEIMGNLYDEITEEEYIALKREQEAK